MNHNRKQYLRREMIGCAKIARGFKEYGKPEEAIAWYVKASEHLFKLGGLLGNW